MRGSRGWTVPAQISHNTRLFKRAYFPSLEATERIFLIVNLTSNFATALGRRVFTILSVVIGVAVGAPATFAQSHGGGEAALKLPDLSQVKFLGIDGHTLLL